VIQNLKSPEIRRALNWFLDFMDPDEWQRRKEAIEQHLESTLLPHRSREDATTLEPISIITDRIGWYLYLVEMALTNVVKYEPIQGSRVLPLFARLGTDFEQMTSIQGIEERIGRILWGEAANPDSGLFEILIALLWKRNGWPEVEFIPESPSGKTPDLRAVSAEAEWVIECKRLSKSSGYSQQEREKWLRMWRPVSDFLVSRRMPLVLDIEFHVELDALPDDFIIEQLAGKLPLVLPPCTLIENEQWRVSVSHVDLEAAQQHLSLNYVKYPSDQLNELIAGRRDPNRGFTYVVGGEVVRIGEGRGNNRFLKTMEFAAGAFWDCDAERAIERKARDIRKHLAEAVQQLPKDEHSVIHVGLETLDGVLVEAERYQRILRTVRRFSPSGKDLRWVYCHLYQSYAPPEKAWVIDETIYYFSHVDHAGEPPLTHLGTMLPRDDPGGSGVHWLRDPP
jgi:hypothetical protein